MAFHHVILGLFLLGLLLAGCAQPSPAASPTPAASVAASATLNVPTVGAAPSAAASASSPTARIPYIPSAKPSELPSATPAPTLAAGVPTLVEFAAAFNAVTQAVFNDSRKAYLSGDVWVIDKTTNEYQYTFFIRTAKARNFGAFDNVRTIAGLSGQQKQVALDEGETGPFYKYSVVMKCYDAHYDVEMALLDYTRIPGSSQYRRTLGPSVMPALVDACPN